MGLRRAALLVAVVLLTAFPVHLGAGGQQSELDKLAAAWRSRRASTHTIRYKCEGTAVVPKGSCNGDHALPPDVRGDVPPEDHQSKEILSIVADLDKKWCRKEVQHEVFFLSAAKFIPEYVVNIYDGAIFKAFTPRDRNTSKAYTPSPAQPDAYLASTDQKKYVGPFFLYRELPVFFGHGIFNPDLDPRTFQSLPDMWKFQPVGQVVHKDRSCLALRSPPSGDRAGHFDEIWVDLERQGAVLRWLKSSSGALVLQADIDYQQTPDGWLVKGWDITHYEGKGRLVISCHFDVTQHSVNAAVEPSEFQISLEPGMVVKDRSKSHELQKVEPDGSMTPFFPESTSSGSSSWSWLKAMLGVVFALVLVIGGARLIRKYARNKPLPH